MKTVSQILHLQNRGILDKMSIKNYLKVVKNLEKHLLKLSRDFNNCIQFQTVLDSELNIFTITAQDGSKFEFFFFETQNGRNYVFQHNTGNWFYTNEFATIHFDRLILNINPTEVPCQH